MLVVPSAEAAQALLALAETRLAGLVSAFELIGQCCEAAQVDAILDKAMPVSKGLTTSGPVSYTHLDVYKRQSLRGPKGSLTSRMYFSASSKVSNFGARPT